MMHAIPFTLSGKNIIVTGASSGIGRSCSIVCAMSGANLLLLGRDANRLSETLAEIEKADLNVRGYTYSHSIDLTVNLEDLNPALDEFVKKHGKFDGFIHSAGVEKTMPLSGMKDLDYMNILSINVVAGFQLAKLLSKRKNSNDKSSFVFISSITGLVGRKGIVGYSASKGALISGIRSIALELADRGIRANCISPGTILTPLMVKYLESLTPEEKTKRLDDYPLGLGVPEDIAYAAIFLLSDASRWITGQNIVIDGGYTAR
jgi:NAD(P)-dependent dehydrogenase (short-subunit alcohol dehydrogenase family)